MEHTGFMVGHREKHGLFFMGGMYRCYKQDLRYTFFHMWVSFRSVSIAVKKHHPQNSRRTELTALKSRSWICCLLFPTFRETKTSYRGRLRAMFELSAEQSQSLLTVREKKKDKLHKLIKQTAATGISLRATYIALALIS